MDGFEYNKIAAAVLIALLVAIVSIIFGEELVFSKKLKKDSYEIVVAHTSSSQASGSDKNEPVDITPFLAKADVKKGEDSFKKCIQCHTTGKSESHKIGPNLWNIVMRKIASLADYAYSSAMKEKKGEWNYENLNQLLFKPRNFAAGTKMSFVGIFDAQERANVIAYIRTLSDSPVSLPAITEPAAKPSDSKN